MFTQHRAEYGVVLEGWGVHEATRLRFEVAFKHDTVDATHIAIQAVHGKRMRHWHVKLNFQNATMVWFKAVRHLHRLVNFPTGPNNHTVYLTRGPACECMGWTTVCCKVAHERRTSVTEPIMYVVKMFETFFFNRHDSLAWSDMARNVYIQAVFLSSKNTLKQKRQRM